MSISIPKVPKIRFLIQELDHLLRSMEDCKSVNTNKGDVKSQTLGIRSLTNVHGSSKIICTMGIFCAIYRDGKQGYETKDHR